jgi:drug/metabolite transporter (DMT)-like permease
MLEFRTMEHLWILFGLVSAFSFATNNALLKKMFAKHNEYLVTWLAYFVASILLLAMLPLTSIPRIDSEFYGSVLIGLPLEIVAIILYIKALKRSPLSLTLPFLSLTPVFLIGVSYLLLGEKVSPLGAFGIVCITIGGYTLNIREFKKGLFQPFVAIFRERGSVYMILVALIYSITASLGKKAITHSSPIFFAIIYWTGFFLLLTPVTLYITRKDWRLVHRTEIVKAAFLPGVCEFVATLSYVAGLSLTKVAYLISVRRLAVLIGVFYGFLLFKESGIGERFLGASLMLAGFVMLAFAT